MAIALAPLLLWAFARTRRTASPGDMVVAVGLLAAMILTHNLMALVFFGLLLAWMVWDVFSGQTFFKAWVFDDTGAGTAVPGGWWPRWQ